MEEFDNGFFGFDDAQKFAAQAAEQTPQQLGQTLKDAGVDLGDYGPRKQENLYDLNAGAMMGGPQTAPPDQAFYGQLTRGPDGTLRGVGPGTIYDRQQILQNALTAGLLNPASDQYQQAIAQQSQQQQAAQNPGNLAAVYQSIKLTPAQENRIAQLDRAAEDVIKRSLSGMLSQREATAYLGQIESLVAPLKQQRSQSVRVFQDMEEIRIRDEAAKAKAIQHSNLLADAQSAQQRVVNLKDAQGNTHSFYMDTAGKMLPLSGGAAKASADPNRPGGPNDTFNKVYTEVYNYLKIPAKDGEQPKPPTKEQIIEEMQKRGAVRDALEGKTQPQQSPKAEKPAPEGATNNYEAFKKQVNELAVPAAAKSYYMAAIDSLYLSTQKYGNDISKWPKEVQEQAMQQRALLQNLAKQKR